MIFNHMTIQYQRKNNTAINNPTMANWSAFVIYSFPLEHPEPKLLTVTIALLNDEYFTENHSDGTPSLTVYPRSMTNPKYPQQRN